MDQIQPFDLQRMLIGEQPPLFYLEIVVRTVIVYVYGLVLLRWLGSRTVGQLSTVEFLLVIALGSAVGDAMFYPDVPILHALAVVTLVVVANKLLDILIARSKTAEKIIEGKPERVIKDGVIAKPFIDGGTLGISEIFQQLRHRGISQLGQIAGAYIEPDGEMTVFRVKDDPPPGLPIEPPWEVEEPVRYDREHPAPEDALLACMQCGTTRDVAAGGSPGDCDHCGRDRWTPAVAGRVIEPETTPRRRRAGKAVRASD